MIAVDAPVLIELLTDGSRADAVEAGLRQSPVSYTHLDVYKRQVQWARNVAIDSDIVPITETQREKAKGQLAEALR